MMRGAFVDKKALCALWFLFAFNVAASVQEKCDKTKCKGPIKFYEELKCKPVYGKNDKCCATRYDCSHLDGRSRDKCYVNGHEYALGDSLRDEDTSNPCDVGCTCAATYFELAQFDCAIVDCFHGRLTDGCYLKRSVNNCCAGEEICPQRAEDRAKCKVDGVTYLDSQNFSPKSDPDLYCICQEGYEGKNVEPFCKRESCGIEIYHAADIARNCSPIFHYTQSLISNCFAVAYRCQNYKDKVLHVAGKNFPSTNVSDEMKCRFGNMTLLVGEELNQATEYNSVCVKCACEVPPFLTCRQLEDTECDVANEPSFNFD